MKSKQCLKQKTLFSTAMENTLHKNIIELIKFYLEIQLLKKNESN